MGANRRRAAERRGRWAEIAGLVALWLKGYRLLARRYRCAAGEVDLIMRRADLVVAVEVKYRRDPTEAATALTPAQRRRIAQAGAVFRSRRHDLAGTALRFDVVLVSPWRWPQHLPDAWRP